MTAQEIAEPNTILRCLVGSSLHGLALEGTDDRDEMGVCIEPPEYVIGLKHFEQWTYRTKPEGVRSEVGDLDLTIYGLRKYVRLALNGNPTILMLLFAPEGAVITCTPLGSSLRAHSHLIVSRRAGRAFLGYLTAQKQRLLGERGQKRVKRPELEEAYGFDVKYASHILRLGYQGIELMTTGRVTLPMPETERELILAVRRGESDLQTVLSLAGKLESDLEDLLDTSPLPEEPDREAMDEWLCGAYTEWWELGEEDLYRRSTLRAEV